MNATVEKNVDLWLEGQYDEKTKQAIRKLQEERPEEITDAFYTKLRFGTGGLRGIMGVGPNRMNLYTIRGACQGVATYLKAQSPTPSSLSVVIGFDNRHHSQEFAEESAKVFAANGIRAYLFRALRPTPLVSFACRYKECDAAVMVTASHNPPIYNGYKVYWKDGAQVVPPHDSGIIDAVNQIDDFSLIPTVSLNHELISYLGNEIDEAYLNAILPLQSYPEVNAKEGKILSVVYSGLHGTGTTLALPALRRWGFSTLYPLEEQNRPDGDFPTVSSPNPESPEALQMGIQTMLEKNADLFIATDPDADRLGVVINHEGAPFILTGNQIGCLMVEHLCRIFKQKNSPPQPASVIKSMVTTEMVATIANHYGVDCLDVLPGFKYIGEQIHLWEKQNNPTTFLFGVEESYGYLVGTHSRDKDGIIASTVICEIALQAKKEGKSLLDLLHGLYQQYGLYREKLHNILFSDGAKGAQEKESMMQKLREKTPKTIGGSAVCCTEDYLSRQKIDQTTGEKKAISLPCSNVLSFHLEDLSQVIIRPSGTEPKVKIYIKTTLKTFASLKEGIAQCDGRAEQILSDLKQQIGI